MGRTKNRPQQRPPASAEAASDIAAGVDPDDSDHVLGRKALYAQGISLEKYYDEMAEADDDDGRDARADADADGSSVDEEMFPQWNKASKKASLRMHSGHDDDEVAELQTKKNKPSRKRLTAIVDSDDDKDGRSDGSGDQKMAANSTTQVRLHDSDDDDDDEPQIVIDALNKNTKKLSSSRQGKRKARQQPAQSESIIDIIEKRVLLEQQQQAAKRKRKKSAKQVSDRKSVAVSACPDHSQILTTATTAIPTPAIQIRQESKDKAAIIVSFSNVEDRPSSKDDAPILLKSLPLRNARLEISEDNFSGTTSADDTNLQRQIPIVTLQDINSILRYISKDFDHLIKTDKDAKMMDMLANAVYDSSIRMTINCDNQEITIFWHLNLQRVLDIANPKTTSIYRNSSYQYARHLLPQRQPKPAAPVICFFYALHMLLGPNHKLLQHFRATKANHHPISAGRVYKVVDNVQYDTVVQQQSPSNHDGPTATTTNIPGLVPVLRPYQKAAVQWMVERETQLDETSRGNHEWELAWYVILEKGFDIIPLPEFQSTTNDVRDVMAYCCPFVGGAGWWAKTYEQARSYSISQPKTPARGGILAESMGLGKTVEVLACILSNSAPSEHGGHVNIDAQSATPIPLAKSKSISGFQGAEQSFKSATNSNFRHGSAIKVNKKESGAGRLVPSRATLIVTPPAILSQWEREIKRHTRALKVCVYPGIRNQDPNKSKLLQPSVLANADIVLTTFGNLMGDLGHSGDNPYTESESRTLRHRKQYPILPSPLTSIRWWRVCLDEAQRIDNPTTGVARMALELHARHRWCVSGTPIGKGKLDDLFGLLMFLNVDPFAQKEWFMRCFSDNLKEEKAPSDIDHRLGHLLCNIMWRSTKASAMIQKQMGIPEQIEKKEWLELSSIERHFYQRQLETTINAAGDVADISTITSMSKRKVKQLDILSNQMQKLRAACLHPQVGAGGLEKIKKRRNGSSNQLASASMYSKILSMDQILDRLIDDARLKCEEAMRLASMHTNAMAALSRLKVEGKDRGEIIPESVGELLTKSCQLYVESLEKMEENSVPNHIVGEAVLAGCKGFRLQHAIVRDGKCLLEWQIKEAHDWVSKKSSLWAAVEFNSASKRVNQIRLRPTIRLPGDLLASATASITSSWKMLMPKECILQVASAAVGGEYVDVASFEVPQGLDSSAWVVKRGFRTNKSKSWRLVIQNFHDDNTPHADLHLYCGMNVELFEENIASDPLQRLHALHNGSLAFSALLKLDGSSNTGSWSLSADQISQKLSKMKTESKKIENIYVGSVLPLHRESQRQLAVCLESLQKCHAEMCKLTRTTSGVPKDCFDDEWWVDIIGIYSQLGNAREQHEMCRRVHEDLSSVMEGAFDRRELRSKPFPAFSTVDGLYRAISIRKEDLREALPTGSLYRCLQLFKFSAEPNQIDIGESAQCQRCKKDWNWTGPMCRHCQISVRFLKLIPDRLFMIVLESIWNFAKGTNRGGKELSAAKASAKIEDRAKLFFEIVDAEKKARSSAERAWRVHLDLLNDLDELGMSKRSMRLVADGEDLSEYSEAELNAIIHPIDLKRSYLEHTTKQAMALAQLRRHQSTLRYLKNQNLERADKATNERDGNIDEENGENCIVCLCSMKDKNRGVLKCGHSFCYSPCLERIVARAPGRRAILCPMRCAIKTTRDEVLVASSQRADDGTKANRKIRGSFGTKVTKIVADVMDVADIGDKSIIFSMWEDMLDVMQAALLENGVAHTRATCLSKLAQSTEQFQSGDCAVLLLNIKNGAEGLTLTNATHVFMVEPVLNAALDLQAISRVHRIGQKEKTYVHRYIVSNSIEVKIDRLREERLAAEDEIDNKQAYKAGGIDGGFESRDELLSILDPDVL